jgi:tetratricopeptide (TPR) repeat protein
MEIKTMKSKNPRGMMTVCALLLLPAVVGGTGLTVWKLGAEGPAQAALQQIVDERDQARKAETVVKKQLEDVVTARQLLATERDHAVAAEKEARSSAEDAKAVLGFLRDNVFLAPGRPTSWSREGLGKDVTLRKAVDAAASKVAGAFPDRPLAEASIREILGASYLDLGEADQAIKQYERAFTLRQNVLGPEHSDTGDCRNKLAVAYRQAGRTDEASRLYDLINKDAEAMRSRSPIRGQTPAPQGDRTSGETPPRPGQKGQGS